MPKRNSSKVETSGRKRVRVNGRLEWVDDSAAPAPAPAPAAAPPPPAAAPAPAAMAALEERVQSLRRKRASRILANKLIPQVSLGQFQISKDVGLPASGREVTVRSNVVYRDIRSYQRACTDRVAKILEKQLSEHGPFKVKFILEIYQTRTGVALPIDHEFQIGEQSEKHHSQHGGSEHQNSMVTVRHASAVRPCIQKLFDKIRADYEDHQGKGSGWCMVSITELIIRMVPISATRGSSFIPTPAWLQNKKCIINVQNDKDDRCFEWALLSALHPAERHSDRVAKYSQHVGSLNFDGIDFPVSADDWPRFERQNSMPIHVFETESDATTFDLVYTSQLASPLKPISLLLIHDGPKAHYTWIKRLNAFMRVASNVDIHACDRCLRSFKTNEALVNHTAKNQCVPTDVIRQLPDKGKHVISFNHPERATRTPFVVYADMESMLVPIDVGRGVSSKATQQHVACHVGAYVVSQYPDLLEEGYHEWHGADAVDSFLKWLQKLQYTALNALRINNAMTITDEERAAFDQAEDCWICKKALGKDRVHDHDHASGKFLGPAHWKCNINRNYRGYKLPVFFHNLRGYDGHFLVQQMGKVASKSEISLIAQNMERFISFGFSHVTFKDTFAFMSTSLERLVEGLNDSTAYKYFNREFPEDQQALLRKKGVFPYEWYDNASKLNATALPAIDAFYSSLARGTIKEESYEHACDVWRKTGCSNFNDYLKLYLKTDVILLADVFEKFRERMYTDFTLDPANYVTLPSYSWDCFLKSTGTSLESFYSGQENILYIVRKGIRGGISMISKRFAKANNPMCAGYDPSKPRRWLLYVDANNLYGWAMLQLLPTGEIVELPSKAAADFTTDAILALDPAGPIGYMFVVDLEVPASLHDYFNDYPLAPETTSFAPSPKMLAQLERLGQRADTTCKLIPNLHNKKEYPIHYRLLQLYLKLGLKLTAVHTVIQFKQERALAPYIDGNTKRRAAASTDFEKDLYKLANNSIYGKTNENVENRTPITLSCNPAALTKAASKPHFKDFKIIGNNMVAIEMRKTVVTFDKAMIVGFAVLDLSKLCMYDFHYNVLKAKYGDRVSLCMTDTDSEVIEVETHDLYADLREPELAQHFDFSDYPKEHPCYSAVNKKVVGKFKDETNGVPIQEFVGHRAKAYSILLADADSTGAKPKHKVKNAAKGVQRACKEELSHDDFKRALFGEADADLRQMVSFSTLRSRSHVMCTEQITKVGLSAIDSKRWVCDDNVNTFAHGHWRTTAAAPTQ